MDLLIATTNRGKLLEYRAMLAALPVSLLDLHDVGLGDMDVEEPFDTFLDNALIKAQTYARTAALPTLADDSGLVVDALGGRPGVFSARYGGPGLDAAGRVDLLLRELHAVPDAERTARFVCITALALVTHTPPPAVAPAQFQRHSDGVALYWVNGVIEGRIAHAPDPAPVSGFGYDPVFIPLEGGLGGDAPLSALSLEAKNTLSHRGRAAAQIAPMLRALASQP